jgi:hypothetical protein
MSGETSWQIAEIELAGLREARTILVHQASTAKIARRRLPECAGRIAAAQEFFTCGGPGAEPETLRAVYRFDQD